MTSGPGLYRIAGLGEIRANVRTNYTAPTHSHDGYSLAIFGGAARIRCRGGAWDVDEGCIVVLEPGEPHGGTPSSRTCVQTAILPEAAFMIRAFGSAAPIRFPRHVVDDPDLAADLARAAAGREGGVLDCLLRRLFTRHGLRAPPSAVAGRSRIEAAIGADLDAGVAAASRRHGVSRWHFSRKLRALTGLSPRDLRRQLRVARARTLIEGGEALASAALRAGFSDQAHMTRQLRSLLGVTPAALRGGKVA